MWALLRLSGADRRMQMPQTRESNRKSRQINQVPPRWSYFELNPNHIYKSIGPSHLPNKTKNMAHTPTMSWLVARRNVYPGRKGETLNQFNNKQMIASATVFLLPSRRSRETKTERKNETTHNDVCFILSVHVFSHSSPRFLHFSSVPFGWPPSLRCRLCLLRVFIYRSLCIGGIRRGACRLNDRQILHMFK